MHFLISKTSFNQICISLPGGATSIVYNFGHQEPTLVLVTNLAPDGALCISCKFSHKVAPLAMITNLVTTFCIFVFLCMLGILWAIMAFQWSLGILEVLVNQKVIRGIISGVGRATEGF